MNNVDHHRSWISPNSRGTPEDHRVRSHRGESHGIQYRLKLLHAEPAQPQSIPKTHNEPPTTESDAAKNTAKRRRLE